MINTNTETGIAFGYISANALDDDLVNDLQMDGDDVYYEENWEEFIAGKRAEFDENELKRRLTECNAQGTDVVAGEFDEEAFRDEFNDAYQPDEPIHEGTCEGVKYRTSWLGGALNVWIFESPHITHQARRASPCVPNAGILDTLDGDVTAYDVPEDWRFK